MFGRASGSGTGFAAVVCAGDAWPTTLAFSATLPLLASAHYTATVTYTVIGR